MLLIKKLKDMQEIKTFMTKLNFLVKKYILKKSNEYYRI